MNSPVEEITEEQKLRLISQDTYSFEDFKEIIACLRSPNGCPWDREQTHESLKPCMMEEAAEVLAAIRILEEHKIALNLQEELGDVLLQVVMHAQIASENNEFCLEDVITDVSRKMIRRHPHVFGEVTVENSEQVLSNWEDIKKQEKQEESWVENPLLDIPKELPSMTQAMKLHKKLQKHYGEEIPVEESISRVSQGLNKLGKETDQDKLSELFADMQYELANIAYHKGIQGEIVLLDKVQNEILVHSVKS